MTERYKMVNNVLTIYKLHAAIPRVIIKPAPKDRHWMDESDSRYAYRCLPLNIANQHGWAVYPANEISAIWHGGSSNEDIEILNSGEHIACSHFGGGILTFHMDHVLKISAGYSLYITGAPNYPKKNIVPLTGIYEADWAPYTFTMNWKFTEANKIVTFSPDEPYCFIFPIKRDLIESFSVEYKDIQEDSQLHSHYNEWSTMRNTFIQDTTRTVGEWQKHYFKGLYPDGQKCPINDHKIKLNINK